MCAVILTRFFNINTPEDMAKAEWIYERLAARH